MTKQTWKGTRWGKSYFASLTPHEVVCYVRDADDVSGQFEPPEEHVSRCDHQAFLAGELQDWVLLHLGDEILLDVLTQIYESGTSADQARQDGRTIQNWQLLPMDLMLVDDVKSADEDGYNNFAMGSKGTTEGTLPSGAHLSIGLNATTGTLTCVDGTIQTVQVPQRTMSFIAYDGHFYMSGAHVMVVSETGKVTYTTEHDQQRYQFSQLFKTGNLFRIGGKIVVEFRALDEAVSNVFELTGRRGYLVLDAARGIVGWQTGR